MRRRCSAKWWPRAGSFGRNVQRIKAPPEWLRRMTLWLSARASIIYVAAWRVFLSGLMICRWWRRWRQPAANAHGNLHGASASTGNGWPRARAREKNRPTKGGGPAILVVIILHRLLLPAPMQAKPHGALPALGNRIVHLRTEISRYPPMDISWFVYIVFQRNKLIFRKVSIQNIEFINKPKMLWWHLQSM